MNLSNALSSLLSGRTPLHVRSIEEIEFSHGTLSFRADLSLAVLLGTPQAEKAYFYQDETWRPKPSHFSVVA